MAKIKIILVVVLVLAISLLLFWRIQPIQDEKQQTSQDSQYDPAGLVAGVKEVVAQIERDSTKRVADFIENQKKEIAEQLLNSQETAVKVTPKQSTDTTQDQQKVIVIDLAHDTNLLFNLNRGEKIYLTFKNARAGYCLYINDTKYNIIEGQSLELEFAARGTFSIKTNLCDLKYSEHGKFIVE